MPLEQLRAAFLMSPRKKVSQRNQRSPHRIRASGAHAAHLERAREDLRTGDFNKTATSATALSYPNDAGPNFANVLNSPQYAYNRDAAIVNEQLSKYYFDKRPSNYELKCFLGEHADLGRRRVFINCFVRLHWEHLGIWNQNWGVPGRPGDANDLANWRWAWEENEASSDFNAPTARAKRYLAHTLAAAKMDFSNGRPFKGGYLIKNPTLERAEDFISSRPWFVFGAQVEAKRNIPLIGRRNTARAMKRVRKVWQMKGVWQNQWDMNIPGWKWSGDEITISDPEYLPKLLSVKERWALGLRDDIAPLPSFQPRNSVPRGHSSRITKASRYSEPYSRPPAPGRPLNRRRPGSLKRRPSTIPNDHSPRVLYWEDGGNLDVKPRRGHRRNQASQTSQFSQISETSQTSQTSVDSVNSVMGQIHGSSYTSLVPGEEPPLGQEDRFEGMQIDGPREKGARNSLVTARYGEEYDSDAGPSGQGSWGGQEVNVNEVNAQGAPRIQVSIANFKLGLSPFDFSL